MVLNLEYITALLKTEKKKKRRVVSADSPSNDYPTTAAPLRVLFPASNGIISTAAWIISTKFTELQGWVIYKGTKRRQHVKR